MVGLLQMTFGAYWMYHCISLIKGYHTPGMLYAYMIPEWLLILEILISLIGVVLGFFVVTGRYGLKRGVGGFSVLWILAQLVEVFVVAF